MTVLDGVVPFPPPVADAYRAAGYWRGETLGSLLRARQHHERTAVATRTEQHTYAELDHQADRLAAGFAAAGLSKGDRVIVQLPNEPALVTVSVALFRLGALPVYALPKHRHSEISYLLEHTDARALIVTQECDSYDYRALAREVVARSSTRPEVFVAGDAAEFTALRDLESSPVEHEGPEPSDVAFFLLSGGTTGRPKLIPRTHDDYAYQLRATAEALEVTEQSAYLAALPAAHNAALGCPGVLGTLAVGGLVLLTKSLSPEQYFPLVERATFTTLMPPVALMWLELAPLFGVDVPKLLIQIGGAPLSPHNARRLMDELGVRLSHWFGMAEGLLSYTRLDAPRDVVAHTVGRPLCPADEVRVMGADGREVAPGTAGELWTRGPYTIRGYYRAEEYNRQTFQDGFLKTGDLVRLDAARNMSVVGRVKDVIIRGGEKVSAEELEDYFSRIPSVREVAVVGCDDEAVGERIVVYIVPAERCPTVVELRVFLAEQGVADYKFPDRVLCVEQLPRTSVGKIDKSALRAAAAA
jgi:2,3-dihydroxybenzoate-AMP ligase